MVYKIVFCELIIKIKINFLMYPVFLIFQMHAYSINLQTCSFFLKQGFTRKKSIQLLFQLILNLNFGITSFLIVKLSYFYLTLIVLERVLSCYAHK